VERCLELACGAENAGRNAHRAQPERPSTSRSTAFACAPGILELSRQSELRAACAADDCAGSNALTLMPSYTNTQPAQPITFAHYPAGQSSSDGAGRAPACRRRSRPSIGSPLGRCAISTTGFTHRPVISLPALLGSRACKSIPTAPSRPRTISPKHPAPSPPTAMVNLGRVTQDFPLVGAPRSSDTCGSRTPGYKSAIMPQKRNPVPLEHVRILASKAPRARARHADGAA